MHIESTKLCLDVFTFDHNYDLSPKPNTRYDTGIGELKSILVHHAHEFW